uniref:Uncharacterized protein n=1 Tax=Anopheles quadriannulatus TaxID=34691 RepID=A0A182XST1_ANOQN
MYRGARGSQPPIQHSPGNVKQVLEE